MLVFQVLLEDIREAEGVYLKVLVLVEGVAWGVVVRVLVWFESAFGWFVETL